MVTQRITSPGPAPSMCLHSPALLIWWLESVRTNFLLPEELSTDPCQLLPQEQSLHSALLGPHLLLLAKEVARPVPRLLSAPACSRGGGLSIHPPAPRARSWHGARYQRVCHIGPFPAVAAKLSHTEEGQKLASPSGRGRSRWLPVALSVSGTVALISF